MNLGNWQLDTVDGGTLSLDGGVVFGIVPKTLWSKVIAPDENNRVRLRNNCLLARWTARSARRHRLRKQIRSLGSALL